MALYVICFWTKPFFAIGTRQWNYYDKDSWMVGGLAFARKGDRGLWWYQIYLDEWSIVFVSWNLVARVAVSSTWTGRGTASRSDPRSQALILLDLSLKSGIVPLINLVDCLVPLLEGVHCKYFSFSSLLPTWVPVHSFYLWSSPVSCTVYSPVYQLVSVVWFTHAVHLFPLVTILLVRTGLLSHTKILPLALFILI